MLVDTGSSNLAVAAASQPEIDSYFNTQMYVIIIMKLYKYKLTFSVMIVDQ